MCEYSQDHGLRCRPGGRRPSTGEVADLGFEVDHLVEDPVCQAAAQAMPVGVPLELVYEPWNPNEVLAPAPSLPL